MSERATCVLCPNPSPMTLDGTNTWIVAEPGSTDAVVIDPGPLDEAHLARVIAQVERTGRRVALTLLTHGHLDHAESAERFHALTGAPVRAFGRGHDDVEPGEVIRVGGLELVAIATPGHSSDSYSYLVPADTMLLTGDTILGRGTTVVAWPDGHLESYLESLQRIEAMTQTGQVAGILPGHGPFVEDAAGTATFYLSHRAERLDQVRAALAAGDSTAREVVERVYADVPRTVWGAAEMSVQAQLEYLREQPSIDD
ncbi:MAG TPA: MBL fold metallo-hydrolase [Intrasporangium sp.]|uniref:MBL fold metallo-hydrolase n=1 Tax=Intrasporangium sp. TaxID=1925024 RepID=UPI002B4A772F|nr:MBL fold metallo-hydrolase [Intrasporangium sp.]HKX67796.1 MBL fold metallo-hydrolase [Intrasporangium sp.]